MGETILTHLILIPLPSSAPSSMQVALIPTHLQHIKSAHLGKAHLSYTWPHGNMKTIKKADLPIVAVFLMDLTKADTLTVEVRVKGADKLSIVMKSFKEVAIKTKRSMKII